MFVTTICFLAFQLGPWNVLGINDRVVPVEVVIYKRAFLVQTALL